MSELYTNSAQTTLSAAIVTTGATSLTVTSATAFPTGGNFRIIVDSEIMLVTAVSGTTFTVTRGAEGTTAATHANAATVTHVLTAGAIDAIRADLSNSGSFASEPAASKAGNLYLPTDQITLDRDNGSAYGTWGPIYPLTSPGAVGDYTWVNQGTATAVVAGRGIVLTAPHNSADSIRALVKAVPATPYTVTIGFLPTFGFGSIVDAGLCVYDGTAKFVLLRYTFDGGKFALYLSKYTNATTFTAHYASQNYQFLGPVWLQLHDDGTNFTFNVSTDGQNWSLVFTVSRTDFLTPSKVGFYANCAASVGSILMNLLHWAGA